MTYKIYLNLNQGSAGIAGNGPIAINERIIKRAPRGSQI